MAYFQNLVCFSLSTYASLVKFSRRSDQKLLTTNKQEMPGKTIYHFIFVTLNYRFPSFAGYWKRICLAEDRGA